MLLLSQSTSRWLFLLVLLLNSLILPLRNWNLLLNGVHDSLSVDRILLGAYNWIILHGCIVESSILTLSWVFVASVLSSLGSVSDCGNILSHFRTLSWFCYLLLNLLILNFSIWHHLRPIKELLICSKLGVLRDRILSLQHLIYLPWSENICRLIGLMMYTIIHIRNQALILVSHVLLLLLAVCFVLCTYSAFRVVTG